jgi:hypothetical protein
MLAHADTHRQDLRPGCAGMRLPGGGHRRHRPLSQRAQTPMDKLIAGYGCSLGAVLSERPPPRDGTASVHSTSGREPCCSTLGPDSVSLWRHRRPVSPTQVSPIQMSRKCRNRCHTWAFNRRADATFEVCVGPPFRSTWPLRRPRRWHPSHHNASAPCPVRAAFNPSRDAAHHERHGGQLPRRSSR